MNGGRSSGDLVRGEALGLAEVVHEDEEPLRGTNRWLDGPCLGTPLGATRTAVEPFKLAGDRQTFIAKNAVS